MAEVMNAEPSSEVEKRQTLHLQQVCGCCLV